MTSTPFPTFSRRQAAYALAGFSLSAFMAIPVQASSPDAWKKLQADTSKACLAKSEFKKARITEGPIWFEHHVVYKISDIWPQPHMKGQTGKVFCLPPYPKGEPEISESNTPS